MDPNLSNLSFRERMARCAERCGNENQLSKKSGIGMSTVARYFKGSEPTRPMLVAVAEAARVRVEWLVTGNGPIELPGSTEPARPQEPSIAAGAKPIGDDFLRLPRILGTQKDPPGSRTLLFDPVYAFLPTPWIKMAVRGVDPNDLALFVAHGDEMEPEINNGEMLFIDTGKEGRGPTEGRKLVRLYDTLCVRRIIRANRDDFYATHLQLPPTGMQGVRFSADQLGHDVDILGRVTVGLRTPPLFPR